MLLLHRRRHLLVPHAPPHHHQGCQTTSATNNNNNNTTQCRVQLGDAPAPWDECALLSLTLTKLLLLPLLLLTYLDALLAEKHGLLQPHAPQGYTPGPAAGLFVNATPGPDRLNPLDF